MRRHLMLLFTALVKQLDAEQHQQGKIDALQAYFVTTDPADAVASVSLLLGILPPRAVSPRELRAWAAEASGVPFWLFERCHAASGDLGETAALIVPASDMSAQPEDAGTLAGWVERLVPNIAGLTGAAKQKAVAAAWRALDIPDRIVFNKILTRTFRGRISQALLVRGLAAWTGLPRPLVARRLSAGWSGTIQDYNRLLAPDSQDEGNDSSGCGVLPQSFHAIEESHQLLETLGDPREWTAEALPEGSLRLHLERGRSCVGVWTIEHQECARVMPQLSALCLALPVGTIVEGWATAWNVAEDRPLPAASLGRMSVAGTVERRRLEGVVVRFAAIDLLRWRENDLRGMSWRERRAQLEQAARCVPEQKLCVSASHRFADWSGAASLIDDCRADCSEAVLLRRLDDSYASDGHDSPPWLLRRPPVYQIEAVLMYAESARGQAASRFASYTLGVWAAPGGERTLIPIAKTGTGLTPDQARRVDRFVQSNTLQRHGPVRVVRPSLAVRLQFDGVEESTRHKSGLALRATRIVALLPELDAERASTLERVRALLPAQKPPGAEVGNG